MNTTSSPTRSTPARFAFAVTPVEPGTFDAFLIDVPSLDGDRSKAARRAYFHAMQHLNAGGLDVQDFEVCVWNENDTPGPLVGPGGIGSGLELTGRVSA